ncbi:LacI family DNA-binding transcriptional regulator [Cohnella candidum]|uniref:LacI family transcriptional regulator n=1 Tax=Cohnella candidum TaxID=2674991 RepID=A0A3G3JYW7_9BACL|nr:LacI family DNA-binding transcriptional regulator [Cohnella candidum]AYQ73435.1 LacI family transcriptional regulator [Cohnella candidum]
MKKVTLQSIADKLSVSKALVSKALSGDPAVNEGTRETIWQTAEELGYRFKTSRKPSAPMQTGNMAVLMPRAYLDDMEYWGNVLHGIEKELLEHQFSMLLSSIDIAQSPKEGLPSSIYDRKVDGAIVMGHLPDSYVTALKTHAIPFIMLDANMLDPTVDHVLANNFLGAYHAVTYLLEKGHRRVAFVGDADTAWSFRERCRGFDEAVRDFARKTGEEVESAHIEGVGVSGKGMYTAPAFPDAVKGCFLKEKPVTGLFCANDLTAFEALKVLAELNVRCPDDVSVIGFDDLTLTKLMQPNLTTVRVPKSAIGSRAADLILRRIREPEAVPELILLSTELVERDSVTAI